MALINNYIKVKELTDNLIMDDILEKYDSTSPYMFCKILDLDNRVQDELENKGLSIHEIWQSVLVVKRVTKIKGFLGFYIQLSDVIEIIPKSTYNKYIYKDDEIYQS